MNRGPDIRMLALAGLLAVLAALPAGAALRTIEQAYELRRDQVQLPAGPAGKMTVRPCDGCRPVALRVTSATRWYERPGGGEPSGQAAVLAAFRAAAAKPGMLVYIYYEPGSRRVRRVVLDTPAPGVRQ